MDDVYLLRVEQFYPVPRKVRDDELKRFKQAEWSGARKSRAIWAAGPFPRRPYLEFCLAKAGQDPAPAMPGRAPSASTATGLLSKHKAQQERPHHDSPWR
jgi:2-oxoglutarate dehydrogenase E1 component